MSRLSRTTALTFALVTWFTTPGAAQCARLGEGDICASGSPWYKFTRLTVQPLDASLPSTTLTLHGGDDLSVDVTSAGDKGPLGRMIVVDGRALLMRDVPHEAGYEIDALDGPVLMSQLVVTLLDQAFPAGPTAVRARHPVKVEQKARAIRIATASAGGRFEAPWVLTGTVRRQAERIEYDLRFSARTAEGPYLLSARGLWQKEAKPASLQEDMRLDGWTVHWLGPMTATAADGTTLDYAAQPAARYWHDVAALRKWISEEPARRAGRRRPADASNPGLQQSITYEAFVTDKNGTRKSVGAGVREYKPGSDVLVEETGHDAVSKTLSLGHGLSISTDVYRDPALTGFGLVLVNDASPCFSWEWFDRDAGDVFRKRQGDAKIRVSLVDGADAQELAAVEFLEDVLLECEDRSNGAVYQAQVRKGSVLRLRP